jgi:hypothetical protein
MMIWMLKNVLSILKKTTKKLQNLTQCENKKMCIGIVKNEHTNLVVKCLIRWIIPKTLIVSKQANATNEQ